MNQIRAVILAVCVWLIAGCTAATPDTSAPAADTQSTASAFPVTVEICGESITFDAPPERAIVFEANMVEIMLELGLDDRIAGIWTGDIPAEKVQPAYRERTEALTVISTESWPPPSFEVILGADPDFVWTGWGYGFSEESGLTPENLAQPELADVSAIQNERFIRMTYKQATPGLENVTALRTIAQGLYPDKFVKAIPVNTALAGNPQSCVESYDPVVDYFPAKVNADYAQDWSVTYFNHYKVVTVGPVGDAAAGDTETYVLVQCGTPVPELTGDLADAYVAEIPIERLFETSGGGSVVTGLEVLGEAGTLIGLGYVPIGDIDQYIPAVAEQIQRDDFLVVNVSEGGFEQVVAAEPDLLIEPYNAERRATARELGIPAMFYNSFWETPLGSAEHIKFWSLLFNKEALANERFAPIEADYLALKEQVAQAVASDERPLVLHGQVTKDNTFSTFGPGRIDYHLTEDAGGRPLLVELSLVNDAFTTLALEEVIEVASDAEFWWNSTYYADEKFGASISAMLADNPLNGSMPPAEEGTTFHIFGRGEDLYKTAYNYRADLILKDLVSILHPELLPDHEPLWMVLINEE